MKPKTILAIGLITLGIVVLAYSGVAFTTPGKPIDFLGMHFTTTHSQFIPPIGGVIALVCGLALLILKPRQA
jgi:hypothetical protein